MLMALQYPAPTRQRLLQFGFFGTSAYLFWVGAAGYAHPETRWQPYLLLLLFGFYSLAFTTLWLCTQPERSERYQALIPAALILAIGYQYLLSIYTYARNPLLTDSFLFADYAAELLLLGQNPYTWKLQAAFSDYRAWHYLSTPLLDGGQVDILPYPALSFLVFLPLKLLAISDSRLILVVALMATLLLLYRTAPAPFKGCLPLLLVINSDFVNWTLGFVTDSFWLLLLVAMVGAWRHRNGRALLFGLACAYKQQPWLLAPFLAMRLWLDEDDPDPAAPWQRVLSFAGITTAVFTVVNLPFAYADFTFWWRGVLSPLVDPLIYYGQGLSMVTQFGLLPLAKDFYLSAAAIVFGTLSLLYWLNFRRIKLALWLFPAFFMWFSYRSLHSYFLFWPLLLILDWLNERQAMARDPLAPRPPYHPYSLLIVSLGMLGITFSFFFYSPATPPITVTLERGEAVSVYHLNRIELAITNLSPERLAPRIAVFSAFSQPFSWVIESGPHILEPGQTGTYVATTDLPYRWLHLTHGAQIVVTDAGGNYRLRGIANIPPDLTLSRTGAIFNANYLPAGQIPTGWQLSGSTASAPVLRHVESAVNLPAIELTLFPGPARTGWQTAGLSQSIPWPVTDILAWVFPPAGAGAPDQMPATVYGLEFDDGNRCFWLLFGGEPGAGYLASNHYYQVRPAPVNRWSQQRIQLDPLYEQFNWSLPPPQRFVRGNLELLTPVITIRLLLATWGQKQETAVSAQFGPLAVVESTTEAADRIAQIVHRQEALGWGNGSSPTVEGLKACGN
jgi:uncharacterized membrane protein